jgi:hypothetical protein
VLPLTVGIRDGVVHLVSTLGSAVITKREPVSNGECGWLLLGGVSVG